MKIAGRIFSILFGLAFAAAGTLVALFTVSLCGKNLDSIPVLLKPVEEARHQAQILMDAVADGEFETAGNLILGSPKLGVDRDPQDLSGQLIWDAFVESYSYELVGECYATNSGIAQDVRVSYLDITSVTKNLRTRSQTMLEERVLNAVDMDEIYDADNNYREDFVMAVMEDAVRDALAEDAEMTGMEFTLNMVYRNGTWVVVSDAVLMTAISGGIVK